MALAVIAARSQPTLIVVHTKELLYQWRARIQNFLGCTPGLIGDGHFDVQPISVAIVNTARKRIGELAPLFGHLVVDECHRVPAALFTDVVSNFPGHYLLGLSATAFRSDEGLTKLINFYMGDQFHKVDQEELQASGAIVKPELIRCKPPSNTIIAGSTSLLLLRLFKMKREISRLLMMWLARAGKRGSGIQLLVSDRVGHCRVF